MTCVRIIERPAWSIFKDWPTLMKGNEPSSGGFFASFGPWWRCENESVLEGRDSFLWWTAGWVFLAIQMCNSYKVSAEIMRYVKEGEIRIHGHEHYSHMYTRMRWQLLVIKESAKCLRIARGFVIECWQKLQVVTSLTAGTNFISLAAGRKLPHQATGLIHFDKATLWAGAVFES